MAGGPGGGAQRHCGGGFDEAGACYTPGASLRACLRDGKASRQPDWEKPKLLPCSALHRAPAAGSSCIGSCAHSTGPGASPAASTADLMARRASWLAGGGSGALKA